MGRLIFNIEDFNDHYQDLLSAVDDAPDINTLITHIIDDINNLINIADDYTGGDNSALSGIQFNALNYAVGLITSVSDPMVATRRILPILKTIYDVVIINIDTIDTWVTYRYELVNVRFGGRSHDILHVDLRARQVTEVGDNTLRLIRTIFYKVYDTIWGRGQARVRTAIRV